MEDGACIVLPPSSAQYSHLEQTAGAVCAVRRSARIKIPRKTGALPRLCTAASGRASRTAFAVQRRGAVFQKV
ncbi:MAG: hypothetical protein ACOYIE_02130, partial [Agathobaculum sp.]|uniref:hypothetical protein n=1 Tax=Agathobaculum sp. TaxID=2048138 RepID=UPI003D93514B